MRVFNNAVPCSMLEFGLIFSIYTIRDYISLSKWKFLNESIKDIGDVSVIILYFFIIYLCGKCRNVTISNIYTIQRQMNANFLYKI